MGGVSIHWPRWLVGTLETVTQEANSRFDVEVSRYPPVPHFLYLNEKPRFSEKLHWRTIKTFRTDILINTLAWQETGLKTCFQHVPACVCKASLLHATIDALNNGSYFGSFLYRMVWVKTNNEFMCGFLLGSGGTDLKHPVLMLQGFHDPEIRFFK